ncbi:MAG: DNA-directed RNA polymerase subunit alpha [Bacteroidia bacterium]|jgi:DNA-directed RNA polymerase subunit alpha
MAILAFQKPDKVIMHKDTDFFGQFEFRPLEKGYGVTIGNSLRRILLSSLEGYAITSVKITGVDHEFSTVKGVIEDVTEIVLNLKRVRFKRTMDGVDNEKIYINIKGQEQFTAGDIAKHTNAYKILNPELVICNMESFVHLEVELVVEKGRGYLPADENRTKDSIVGVIPIDAVFTPIINVKFLVEDYRVEQKTDYEKLNIEISTDGSIHPEEALKEAAKILIQHFMLFSDELITLDTQVKEVPQEVDENLLHVRKILKTPLSDLDLSVRAYNCLKAADIKSLSELVSFDIADLLKFRNFGKKSLSELEELVRDKGLTFGMDVAKFKLNED